MLPNIPTNLLLPVFSRKLLLPFSRHPITTTLCPLLHQSTTTPLFNFCFPIYISHHHIFNSLRYKNMCTQSQSSQSEQESLIEKLQIFRIQGRDKRGREILRIVGKFFSAPSLSVEAVKKYLEERIYTRLEGKRFSILYIHSGVERAENFPGVSALRSIYDAIPVTVKESLEAVFFVHPGLQARLFLATFGRFLFSGGLYGKLRYVNRIAYLWDHARRGEVEIPEFVYDHDEDLEYRPMMDYGLESDHARVYGAPAVDLDSASVSMYSMRCIS